MTKIKTTLQNKPLDSIFIFNQLDDSIKEAGIENKFPYILSKACLYLKMGHELYLKNDYLDWSTHSFDIEILQEIESGCNQFLQGRGLLAENPLSLSIPGFYSIFKLFHFEVVSQRANKITLNGKSHFLDKMTMKHLIEDEKVTYFNLVPNVNSASNNN